MLHPLNQSDAKRNNRGLVTGVSTRFWLYACFNFEFLLANNGVDLCYDWLLKLLWF